MSLRLLDDRPALGDPLGRRMEYLRLSVTDACNFRCTYCLPDGWKPSSPATEPLSVPEIRRLVTALALLGLAKVRLTGGEPTTRHDLAAIMAAVSSVPGVATMALSTNGWNMDRRVDEWSRNGLQRVNVSVDSLRPDVFARITGHDRLPAVLRGVERALQLGLRVKINAVLMQGTNDDELDDFLAFVRVHPVTVRFIELMRTNAQASFFLRHHVPLDGIRGRLLAGGWRPRARAVSDGPAEEFEHADHAGGVGLIAPYRAGFCDTCNRVRVTSRGGLRLCLFGDGQRDLRPLLQHDDQREELAEEIRCSLALKPPAHRLHDGNSGDATNLSMMGG